MQLKVELFLASAAYNETFKRFGRYLSDCTVHASSTSEAIYLRLQGVLTGITTPL
jgi:hypothetical protein